MIIGSLDLETYKGKNNIPRVYAIGFYINRLSPILVIRYLGEEIVQDKLVQTKVMDSDKLILGLF